MTMSIQERSEFSGLPPLIGAVDIAERAGVSRSRITELMDSPEFPVPAMTVRSKGRLYFESDIENYLATRNTKPGRPKKGEK